MTKPLLSNRATTVQVTCSIANILHMRTSNPFDSRRKTSLHVTQCHTVVFANNACHSHQKIECPSVIALRESTWMYTYGLKARTWVCSLELWSIKIVLHRWTAGTYEAAGYSPIWCQVSLSTWREPGFYLIQMDVWDVVGWCCCWCTNIKLFSWISLRPVVLDCPNWPFTIRNRRFPPPLLFVTTVRYFSTKHRCF